ncbi:PadR family transcriptional regulator [Nonomuraea fuscirosea]|uniref:PadR family transcriptional regulator n=1 Tax=Nonomuraea fuscirosea TaxID=1291556 RepID=UPI003719018F
MQDAVLAMLAKEPSHGYELHARLRRSLGPLGESMNRGQIYVTLARLERAGLVTSEREDGLPERPERKVHALTPAGQQRVTAWLAEVGWPKPDLAEFHLKLAAAAAGRLADPVELIAAQRRELLRRLREAQQAALAEPAEPGPAEPGPAVTGPPRTGHSTAGPAGPGAGLLLEGVMLRLRADLRWLDVCERAWSRADDEIEGG